jgi:hypothetical protein
LVFKKGSIDDSSNEYENAENILKAINIDSYQKEKLLKVTSEDIAFISSTCKSAQYFSEQYNYHHEQFVHVILRRKSTANSNKNQKFIDYNNRKGVKIVSGTINNRLIGLNKNAAKLVFIKKDGKKIFDLSSKTICFYLSFSHSCDEQLISKKNLISLFINELLLTKTKNSTIVKNIKNVNVNDSSFKLIKNQQSKDEFPEYLRKAIEDALVSSSSEDVDDGSSSDDSKSFRI